MHFEDHALGFFVRLNRAQFNRQPRLTCLIDLVLLCIILLIGLTLKPVCHAQHVHTKSLLFGLQACSPYFFHCIWSHHALVNHAGRYGTPGQALQPYQGILNLCTRLRKLFGSSLPVSVHLDLTVCPKANEVPVNTRQHVPDTGIQPQGFQRMETGQRRIGINIATQHFPWLNAPATKPGLRPQMHHHRLVQLKIILAPGIPIHAGRQEQGFGVGVTVVTALQLQSTTIQAVYEHLQHVDNIIEGHTGRARRVLTRKPFRILEGHYRRVQPFGVVDVHTGQQPGFNAAGIHQAQCGAHVRNEIERHAGTGARHNTHPVQHEVLLLPRKPGQRTRRLLGRAHRNHVNIKTVFQLYSCQRLATGLQKFGFVIPARRHTGRQHASIACSDPQVQRFNGTTRQDLGQQLSKPLCLPGIRTAVSRQPHAETTVRDKPG